MDYWKLLAICVVGLLMGVVGGTLLLHYVLGR